MTAQPRIDLQHERQFTCSRCHVEIVVGGLIDDLDPETYVGAFCGCRPPKEPETPSGTDQAIGRARTAQQTAQQARRATV